MNYNPFQDPTHPFAKDVKALSLETGRTVQELEAKYIDAMAYVRAVGGVMSWRDFAGAMRTKEKGR